MSQFTCPGAAFDLRQCNEFEYILLGDLRDVLEDDPGGENRHWLLAILEALIDTLPKEIALKSKDGYLSDVLGEFPSWESEVVRLEEQYFSLYRQLRVLRDRIVSRREMVATADRLRLELDHWMDSFVRLHRDEQKLVLTAVNLEVGAGD